MLIEKRDINISEFHANLVSEIETPKRSTLVKTQNERLENVIWNGLKAY